MRLPEVEFSALSADMQALTPCIGQLARHWPWTLCSRRIKTGTR